MIFAVYGTLKSGFRFHSALKDSKFLGEFVTKPEYTMYSLSGGSFPAIVQTGDTPIQTELYEIEDHLIVDHLYGIEGYIGPENPNNLYDLKQIETPFGEANIFVFGNPKRLESYELPVIKEGIWK